MRRQLKRCSESTAEQKRSRRIWASAEKGLDGRKIVVSVLYILLTPCSALCSPPRSGLRAPRSVLRSVLCAIPQGTVPCALCPVPYALCQYHRERVPTRH